ncbi:heat shock 70 kDa protein 12A-like [Pholidichthys leucotaenia]
MGNSCLTTGDSYVIAIDFGTAYSGYAFSLTTSSEDIDPRLKLWGEEVGLETPKTPTCVLFDEHEEFLAFGYKAKDAYLKMRSEDARKKFFFNCFKMELYGKNLNDDLLIKAANGKSMKAMKVVSESLRFLKEEVLKVISENTYGRKFKSCDFTWVLTVPAIWDPSAKQFMREAATEAGIVTTETEDKLLIALEPETASVWCKKLSADGFLTENCDGVTLDQQRTQYIVVDCGGGTIDITVHKVLDEGRLKELYKASGNDLGGQTVDRNFREFLREIFCDGVWEEYERKYPGEVQKLMYEFTVFKKTDGAIEISCPYNLGEIAREKNPRMEEFFKIVSGASWDEGRINISREKMRSFFDESLKGMTELLNEILKKGIEINYILLVGGYAESQVLRQHVKDQFESKQCRVLCPSRPQQAILKGAVQFGRNPHIVTSRKSAFTYGIEMCESFQESKHRADKKFMDEDGVWCRNIFWKLVKIDEDVGWNESREEMFQTSNGEKTLLTFFRTEKENPMYVDEGGIEKIGTIAVDSPEVKAGLNPRIKLGMKFGFTEMKATATDIESGSTQSIKLNFMTKLKTTPVRGSSRVSWGPGQKFTGGSSSQRSSP